MGILDVIKSISAGLECLRFELKLLFSHIYVMFAKSS